MIINVNTANAIYVCHCDCADVESNFFSSKKRLAESSNSSHCRKHH